MSLGFNDLTRSYLETLSSPDLIDLSYDYGIDIPDNLNRNFIIRELLDTLETDFSEENPERKLSITNSNDNMEVLELPFSYNENRIVGILTNPAWCYVTWDFRQDILMQILEDPIFDTFVIRFSYHKDTTSFEVAESVDIKINANDQEQFVLLTSSAKSFHISLVATYTNKTKTTLATSQRICKQELPCSISLAELQKEFPPIQSLSGYESILRKHYNEHRHSFAGI